MSGTIEYPPFIYKRVFLWWPKVLINGEVKWLTVVMKKLEEKTYFNGKQYCCGYMTEEEAFLENI